MEQNTTDFKASPEHVVFADAYILSHGNISKAFKSINQDRQIYYRDWRHQEGFEEWLSDYAKKEVMKRIGKWYLIAEKYADAGSYKHLELLMQLAQEYHGQKLILSTPDALPRPHTVVFTSRKEDVGWSTVSEEELEKKYKQHGQIIFADVTGEEIQNDGRIVEGNQTPEQIVNKG